MSADPKVFIWRRSEQPDSFEAERGLGSISAPLLAGFSLSTVALLTTLEKTPRLAEFVVVAMTFSTASLLTSLQLTATGTRYVSSPADRRAWRPEITRDRAVLEDERKNQRVDLELALKIMRRAGWAYNAGLLAFFLGITLLLVPAQWTPARAVAVGIAAIAMLIEGVWIAGNGLWIFFIPKREELEKHISLPPLDDESAALLQGPGQG